MALSSMLKLVPVLLATYILRPADRQWGRSTIKASNNSREELVVKIPIVVNTVLAMVGSCESPVGITRIGDSTSSTITVVRQGAWPNGSLLVDWLLICI